MTALERIESLLIEYGDACIAEKAVYTYKVDELKEAINTIIKEETIKAKRGLLDDLEMELHRTHSPGVWMLKDIHKVFTAKRGELPN